MAKTIVTLSVAVLCMNLFCSEATKEMHFERILVEAFKHKDFDEFEKLIITPEDLVTGFTTNSSGLPAAASPENTVLVEKYKRTYLDDYRTLFHEIIRQGEVLGITWNNIEYESFVYKTDDPLESSGAKFLNGHINITVKGKYYFFYGIDAQEYKSGFKVSYIRSIKQGTLKEYVDSNNEPELK